jgi:hypothetical protein
MNPASPCPPGDILADLAAGGPVPAGTAAHAASCEACRSALAILKAAASVGADVADSEDDAAQRRRNEMAERIRGEAARRKARIEASAGRPWRFFRLAAVAAGLAACFVGVWRSATGPQAGRPGDPAATGGGPSASVAAMPAALLSRAVGVDWEGPDSPSVGQRASRFRLRSGLAEIRYDSGVTAVLEGPADLEVTGPAVAALRRGRAVTTVPEGAKGFVVATPSAEITDLGTEFGVAVDESDSGVTTTVQVYRGEVVAESRSAERTPDRARRLTSGNAVAISAVSGKTGSPAAATVEVAFREDRFVRRFPSPAERRAKTGDASTPYNVPEHRVLRIHPAPGPVAIDGDLGDWDLSGEFRGRCAEPYGDDYHVRGAMMYDTAGVYVAAVVGDPDPLRNVAGDNGRFAWRGGAVQVRLSTDPAAGWPLDAENRHRDVRPRDRNPRITHLMLWHSSTLGRPCLHIAYGMDFHREVTNPAGFRGAVVPEPGGRGYRLEYFIPWELLGVTDGRPPPKAGDVTAVSWTVNWAYENGRDWRGQWIDFTNPPQTGWTFHRGQTWGKAIWEPAGR